MRSLSAFYASAVTPLAGSVGEGLALLLTRVAVAGVFWRSGRTKVVDGSWLDVSGTTHFLFETEYAGVPLPAAIAAPMPTYAEHLFPVLLLLGLATRFSALSLLVMTLVIQLFVYPDAWWNVHLLWVAMTATLISRGAGLFSLDAVLAARRRA